MPMVAGFPRTRLLQPVLAFLLITLVAPSCVPSARANGPTVGFDGGSVVPLASPEIRLVRESVDLHLPLTDASLTGRAECFYALANLSGNARTFPMSFVGAMSAGGVRSPGLPTGMRVRVGGRDVDVRMERADSAQWARFEMAEPDSLPVWSVAIPAGETTFVEIEYAIAWSGGSDGSSDGRDLRYFARPAALWAGTIGHATFRLHLGEMVTNLLRDRAINRDDSSVRLRIEPPDARWTRDGLEWVRTEWEPDTDFRFGIDWDVPQDPAE